METIIGVMLIAVSVVIGNGAYDILRYVIGKAIDWYDNYRALKLEVGGLRVANESLRNLANQRGGAI